MQTTDAVVMTSNDKSSGKGSGYRAGRDLSDMCLTVRVAITELATGKVKLETRLPATFLQPLYTLVPQLVRCPPPSCVEGPDAFGVAGDHRAVKRCGMCGPASTRPNMSFQVHGFLSDRLSYLASSQL